MKHTPIKVITDEAYFSFYTVYICMTTMAHKWGMLRYPRYVFRSREGLN